MISSSCICSSRKVFFKPVIVYNGEKPFDSYKGLMIGRCEKCGMLKTFRTTPSSQINPEVSDIETYNENLHYFRYQFTDLADRIGRYKTKGRILDVGASSGILMKVFKDRGFTVSGIEPNKNAFMLLSKQFKTVYHGHLGGYLSRHHTKFDVVIYNHVFEHIPDLHRELRLICSCLVRGGILAVSVPNRDNFVFQVRKKFWESLLPQQHIWHFSSVDLKRLLKQYGFTVLEEYYVDHTRLDYPLIKKIYFSFLTGLNRLYNTGEAVTLIVRR